MQSKTKILSTLGPASFDEAVLSDLLSAVDGVRFNFSHSTVDEHVEKARAIRSEDRNVTCLADLPGGKYRLRDEQPITDLDEQDEVSVGYESVDIHLPDTLDLDDFEEEDTVQISDGTIKIVLSKQKKQSWTATVKRGGRIESGDGLTLPDRSAFSAALTSQDREYLKRILDEPFDMVALSFVRNAEDVKEAAKIIRSKSGDVRPDLIAKIETEAALDNIDGILDYVEGVMVARGDLGAEVGVERVPYEQKRLIERANQQGKIVITATQMLDSMVQSQTPTRAEVSDVANAVLDGSDVVMLSEETAIGDYPLEAVRTMRNVIRRAEQDFQNDLDDPVSLSQHDPPTAASLSRAAAGVAQRVQGSAVAVFTTSGFSARLMSKTHPDCPIISLCTTAEAYRKTRLYRNIEPMQLETPDSTDALIESVRHTVRGRSDIGEGPIIVLGGLPLQQTRITNFLHVIE